MNKDKMSTGVLMAMGSLIYLGYKYMDSHPMVVKNVKNVCKSATKKLYKMLDEMD